MLTFTEKKNYTYSIKANLLKGRDAKPRVQGRETKAAGCRIKIRFSDVLWTTEERSRINICGRLI